MKKCVVTGAAGFTGYSLGENLIAHGYFVYAVVRPQSEHNVRLAGMRNVQLVQADISEYGQLYEKIKDRENILRKERKKLEEKVKRYNINHLEYETKYSVTSSLILTTGLSLFLNLPYLAISSTKIVPPYTASPYT